MIRTIRKYFAHHIAMIFIWISVLSIAGVGTLFFLVQHFSGTGEQKGTIFARVNGYDIPVTEYRVKIAEEEHRLAYLRKQFGGQANLLLQAMGMNMRPEEQALNSLIREKLLLWCADQAGISVSSEEMGRRLQDPLFLMQAMGEVVVPYLLSEQGALDYGRLTDYLRRQGISAVQFKNMIEQHIKERTALQVAEGALYIPLSGIKEHFIKDFLKKKFSVLRLPLSALETTIRKTGVKQEELVTYFNHQNEIVKKYWTPETRSGTTWVIPMKSYDIMVTDKDIQDYYMRNKKNFVVQEEKRDSSGAVTQPLIYKELAIVKDTIKNLVMAEKFKRLFTAEAQHVIAQSKEDPASLATFVEGKKAKKVALTNAKNQESRRSDALFSLAVGGRQSFIEGNEGVIVELEQISPSAPLSFEAAKSRVEKDWYATRARQDVQTILQQLAHSKTGWAEKAKELGGSFEVTSWINPAQEGEWRALQDKKLPVEKMVELTDTDSVIYDISSQAGYLIKVTEMEPFDSARFEMHSADIRSRMLNEERGLFDQAFIDSLIKNAKIDVYKGTIA
jgi:hypothetical protein